MNDAEMRLLRQLEKHQEYQSARKTSEALKIDYSSLMSILSKLSEEKMVHLKKEESVFAELTPEGKAYSHSGLPERKLADALKKSPVEFNSLSAIAGLSPAETQIAIQWARKNNWIKIEKGIGKTIVSLQNHPNPVEEEKLLARLKGSKLPFENTAAFTNLKNRNLISLIDEKEFEAKITPEGIKALSAPQSEATTQLTPQMLKDGRWRDVIFREYDITLMLKPKAHYMGRKHFYLQFVRDLKERLVSLGFQESYGPFTELEFWNMDALFMPQDHPARDIHDVFHLDLKNGSLPEKKLVENVKRAHEKGVAGSKGWGYEWSERMAAGIALRSQTTTVSARALAAGIKPPAKIFCIGKVFRPDEIDWKHFLEFNQCEGIVVDENMTFRELLGYLRSFAIDIFGAQPSDVQFAPSYFPFTEPSVEMMVRINGKWTEVGGAGIFRPEVTVPLGCNVPVLAWGLGLDRLAMIKLELKDIRDLHSRDLEFLRSK